MVHQEALINSGCTRCLMRRALARRLGLRLIRLKKPIAFEQVDGSTLGGAPTTHVMELVQLGIGTHREHLRFVVVDTMIEPVILGLAWLDKWEPTIWWEGGFRKLHLKLGPEPHNTEPQSRVGGGVPGR